MHLLLRLANWLFLAFFGVAVLFLAMAQPAASIVSSANLVPFGLALIAARPDSQRVASWGAFAINILWALVYLSVFTAALLGQAAMTVTAAIVGLVVAVPCSLNAVLFWRRLRR
jgi:hypothetical protein